MNMVRTRVKRVSSNCPFISVRESEVNEPTCRLEDISCGGTWAGRAQRILFSKIRGKVATPGADRVERLERTAIHGGPFTRDVESRVPSLASKGGNMQKLLEDSTTGLIGRTVAEGHPTHEEIELRAYEAYLARGSTPGQDVADWLQAERELLEERGKIGRAAKAAAA